MYLAPVVVRTVKDAGGVQVPVAGVTLTAVADDPGGCDLNGQSLNVGTTGADGTLHFSLPGGSWLIEPEAPYLCDSSATDPGCPGETGLLLVTDPDGGSPTGTVVTLADLVVFP